MHAVIEVDGVKALFDGEHWSSVDAELAERLNKHRWMGSRHSEYGIYGSHAVALAEELGGEVVSVEDEPSDVQDVVG